MRDYVKEFSSLMLDIKNMFEEDKLFNFVSGLQAWAQTELRRQGVKDMPAAMAASDCLVDYKLLGTTVAGQKPKMDGSRKQKVTGKPSPDQTKGKKEGNAANLRAGESQNGQQTSKPIGCFICQGPHRARDCPRRENVSALQTARKEEQDSDSDDSTSQLNPLQLVNTFHKPNLINKLTYVFVQVNGVVVRAMVDTGATECCLSNSIATTVGLIVEPYASVVISLNGEDHRVDGMARTVPFRMGDWIGHCDFMVMYLRGFELVLGMDFLMAAKVGILPYLGSLAFLEFGTPYVVKIVPMEEEPNFDLSSMVHTSDIVGVWPEGSKNQSADDHGSQGLRQAVKTET